MPTAFIELFYFPHYLHRRLHKYHTYLRHYSITIFDSKPIIYFPLLISLNPTEPLCMFCAKLNLLVVLQNDSALLKLPPL